MMRLTSGEAEFLPEGEIMLRRVHVPSKVCLSTIVGVGEQWPLLLGVRHRSW
jgi:hypothetical protein